MSAKKIPRMEIPLDIEAKYFQRDEDGNQQHNLRSAQQNKKLYMDTYTTKFNIPAQYVLQAQLNPKDPTQSIQLVKFVLLDDEDPKPITHRHRGGAAKGETIYKSYQEMFAEYEGNLVLQLLQESPSFISR